MILFDLDGTLVDSMGSFSRIATRVIMKYFGWDERRSAEGYRRTSGLPFYYQLETLFPGHPAIAKAALDYETLKLKGYAERPFYPDVAPALRELHRLGVTLCVSSNNQMENVAAKLLGALPDVFTEILGFRPGFLKGPDHFNHLMTRYRLAPENLLFVGDSLHDARMAHSANIPFVARLGTFTRADFAGLSFPLTMIRDFGELTASFGELRCAS